MEIRKIVKERRRKTRLCTWVQSEEDSKARMRILQARLLDSDGKVWGKKDDNGGVRRDHRTARVLQCSCASLLRLKWHHAIPLGKKLARTMVQAGHRSNWAEPRRRRDRSLWGLCGRRLHAIAQWIATAASYLGPWPPLLNSFSGVDFCWRIWQHRSPYWKWWV